MKKITIVMMGLFLAVTLATSVFAAGPGRGPGYRPYGKGNLAGPQGLNLTAEQKIRLNEIQAAQFKEVLPLQEQMLAKRDALRKLWLEPNPDKDKITAAQGEVNAVRDQIQEKRTVFHLAAFNVLTAEQQAKVKSWHLSFGKAGAKEGAKARARAPGHRSADGYFFGPHFVPHFFGR
ncbi:MAG: Spy/CpxP family protein refolding chaperone [Syntrophaceae bacterium]|nr:Spy/CpxP family protein refolding chaperone [Syntrophaceae bacterium]